MTIMYDDTLVGVLVGILTVAFILASAASPGWRRAFTRDDGDDR